MKANQAMPADELIPVQENRITDIFAINPAIEKGFSASRPQTPFVNSLSGTAFSTAMTVEAFINEYSEDPQIQEHIDNIVQGLVAQAISLGFHSLGELMEVFNEPPVQKLISSHHVELKLIYPEDVLEKAFDQAADYAKKIALDRCSLKQIMSRSTSPEPVNPDEIHIRKNSYDQ